MKTSPEDLMGFPKFINPTFDFGDGDGYLKAIEESDLVVGAVLREVNRAGLTPQFGDCVVTKVHDGLVYWTRIHAYVNENGELQTSQETLALSAHRLVKYPGYRVVCVQSRDTKLGHQPTSVLRK